MLVRQSIKEKENSEFKPAVRRQELTFYHILPVAEKMGT